MSSWRQYLTFSSPMTNAWGNLVLELKTLDAAENVTVSVSVTGASTEDEISTAFRAVGLIDAALEAASATVTDPESGTSYTLDTLVYNGSPAFSGKSIFPTFRVTRTDFCICVWSQAQFRLKVVSNTTGAIVTIASDPSFLTIQEAKDLSVLMGGELVDANYNSLTDSQIAMLIRLASSRIVSVIKNPIVVSGYLHEIIGTGIGATKFKMRPIVSYDAPNVKRPSLLGIATNYFGSSADLYNVDKQDGFADYRFSSSLINTGDPFDHHNEVKWSYTAGYISIPSIIKEKTLQLAFETMEAADSGGIKSMKGGSGAMEWFSPKDTGQWLANELADYRIF